MVTRKTAKKAKPAVKVEPLSLIFSGTQKTGRKKFTRKEEKLISKRIFLRDGSLAAASAKVQTYAMSNDDGKDYHEAEAVLVLSDGSNTIDLCFFATDKKAARAELAGLNALAKLIDQAREAFESAVAKHLG